MSNQDHTFWNAKAIAELQGKKPPTLWEWLNEGLYDQNGRPFRGAHEWTSKADPRHQDDGAQNARTNLPADPSTA